MSEDNDLLKVVTSDERVDKQLREGREPEAKSWADLERKKLDSEFPLPKIEENESEKGPLESASKVIGELSDKTKKLKKEMITGNGEKQPFDPSGGKK